MSDYVSFRDRYRITLTHRKPYLVRTIRGTEVLARWDAAERQFRRIEATSVAPRNTPMPTDVVAAVATARRPGTTSKQTRWVPFDRCIHDTAPPKETAGVAIVAILDEQGPKTTAELRALLPHIPPATVRSMADSLAGRQQVGRSFVMVGNRAITAWTVGGVTYEPRKPVRGRPTKEDAYTPAPWIHPIRRRALGLPVAQAPRIETDTDYAHPRRVA